MAKRVVLLLLLLVIGTAAVVFYLRQPPLNPVQLSSHDLSEADTINLVKAVSLLENLKIDESLSILTELAEQHPESPAVLQNYAIGLLTKVSAINTQIANNDTTDEEKATLRAEFPDLFGSAKEAIATARKIEPKNVQLAQLDIIREERRLEQLPQGVAASFLPDLIASILEELKEFPGDGVLTAKLANIAESLEKTDPSVTDKVIKPLEEAQKANPRNAYLLARLFRMKEQREDKSLTELVDVAIEVAKPQAWLMNRQVNGMDLAKNLKDAAGKIQDDPDGFFFAAAQWINVFVGATTIQKADADVTAKIEPLSLVRLDQAYRHFQAPSPMKPMDIGSLAIANDLTCNGKPIQIEGVEGEIISAQWFDWDVDLRPELLLATRDGVYLYELADKSPPDFGSQAPLTLNRIFVMKFRSTINCVLPVDLYEIRSPLRSDVIQNLADPYAPQSDARQTAVRDIVVGTSNGLQVIGLRFNRGAKRPDVELVDVTETSLPKVGSVSQVFSSDIEADGDLDLVAIIDGQISIFENRGARNFLNANANNTMPPPADKVLAIAPCDYDRDIDIDWMISFADKVGVLLNIQHGQFIYRELDQGWSHLKNASQLIAAELDGNVSWDWVARTESGINVVRTTTIPSHSVSVLDHMSLPLSGTNTVAIADLDNDARLDVIAASDKGIDMFLQSQSDLFGFATKKHHDGPGKFIQLNYDLMPDGLPIALTADAKSLAVMNALPPKANGYINFRLKGMADNNGGGRINEFAIGSTIELFTDSGYQARVVSDDVTHFGLKTANNPYSLRVIFPNGLTQTIVDPPKNKLIEERQELKGSCPFLYAWDGHRWKLVTDLLWNAPLGLQFAKGQTLPDRRWEYLLVPRDAMVAKDGVYELRVTEELWEITYFDQIELLVYDHPADQSLASNEKVGPAEIAQPGTWRYSNVIPAAGVRDSSGRDWAQQLSFVDGVYALPWKQYICQGLVDENFVEIDIPETLSKENAQLLLTGWYHPTDTSLNIGIEQDSDREPPKPPRMELVDQDGAVQEIISYMGFPGGKPKTMVVDLSNKLKSTAKSLRIASSCELYWDQVAFISGKFEGIESAKKLNLISADLHYRGFSELMSRKRHEPHWYDYQKVSTEPKWNLLAGLFTRYGDCRKMLDSDDDHMVVMGSGDEITLKFDAELGAIPDAYVRDIIIHNIGWDKDADLNTITGQSSLPLPFKAMKSYPPPLEQAGEQLRVDRLNESTLTRKQYHRNFWIQANQH